MVQLAERIVNKIEAHKRCVVRITWLRCPPAASWRLTGMGRSPPRGRIPGEKPQQQQQLDSNENLQFT